MSTESERVATVRLGALDEAQEPQDLLPRPPSRWSAVAGGLFAAGLVAAALLQLGDASAAALATMRRLPAGFWAVFAALYLTQPVADLMIYRHLWRLPVSSGLPVMARKTVINEAVLGYAGEAYFYLWARRRPGLSHAPFGAVKDVNVMSALAANVQALLMLAIAGLALHRADLAREFGPVIWPGLAMVAVSFGIILVARRVFSLSRRDLGFVTACHGVRLAVTAVLTLWMWSLALPGVTLDVWWLLLTGRFVLARVPFLANKDLLFANLLLALFGPGSATTLLLASLAIATLATHVAVAVLTGAPDIARALRRPLASAAGG